MSMGNEMRRIALGHRISAQETFSGVEIIREAHGNRMRAFYTASHHRHGFYVVTATNCTHPVFIAKSGSTSFIVNSVHKEHFPEIVPNAVAHYPEILPTVLNNPEEFDRFFNRPYTKPKPRMRKP